jgi:integrase
LISRNDGKVQALLGGLPLKTRVQHPAIKLRTDRPAHPWFFRYWADEFQPDGTAKTLRKYCEVGPSVGPDKITKKQAEVERDKVLAPLNKPTIAEKVVDGMVLLERFVERFKSAHVNAEAGGRYLLKKPSREKYLLHLDQKIVPAWGKKRLCEILPDEVQSWLFETCDSWWMMHDLKGLFSTIYAKAMDWGYWPEDRRTPISKVDIGTKWVVRPHRILTPDETDRVLARLDDPNLLISETCLDTGTRISEVTGLKLKHVDLARGCIRIEQRNWRGDIDSPKTESSKRVLALGSLVARYEAWIVTLKTTEPEAWLFPKRGDRNSPVWDSGVRQALKKAAKAEKCDFPGFGPHSLRRANITLRQEVGGSAIEVSRIAGHSKVNMTSEYTVVQLKRQDELTRKIQDLRGGSTDKKLAAVESGESIAAIEDAVTVEPAA